VSVTNDSRAKMLRSAAALFSTRGASATSFSEVIAESGAPRGSIYHHFPEGKKQLEEDAIRWTGERVLAHLRASTATTPGEALAYFVAMWRHVVVSSGASAGCAVAGVTVDTPRDNADVMQAVSATFHSWTDLLADQLAAAGLPRPRAGTIALATLAGMEGALILCRAEGTVAPLDTVAEELLRLLSV
jgi:TetR/AcrR family transcriptional regulator, lmrAB and yxaGH operons repressor